MLNKIACTEIYETSRFLSGKKLIVVILFFLITYVIYASINEPEILVIQRVQIKGNESCTWIQNTGIFNQYTAQTNSPGLYWPCGIKSYCFTSGLSSAGIINGKLGMFSCTYRGELVPGVVLNNELKISPGFKLYSVKTGDNEINNPDYANWYKMIPYGAPYKDVNNNCAYDQGIDIPGFPDASQTVFICMTDADSTQRSPGEGFGGGVKNPLLMAEIRLTVWTYSDYPFNSSQMFRYQIINKGNKSWDSLYFTLYSDPDIPNEFYNIGEFLGCDTLRHLGFAYGRNTATVSYGLRILRGLINKTTGDSIYLSSFTWERSSVPCEWEVPGNPQAAYFYMKGLKSDGTSFLDPTRPLGNNRYLKTKYIYSGDPETNTGWTAAKGKINNCYGNDTGSIEPVIAGDKKMVMGIGAGNFSMMPGDTQLIMFSQTLAGGLDSINSVTRLKKITDKIDYVFQKEIKFYAEKFCPYTATSIPVDFSLSQNYPNPFNLVTIIKFSIPVISDIKLEVFDVLGRHVTLLAGGEYNPGYYEITFDAKELPSGIYFYRLVVINKKVSAAKIYSSVKKFALLK